jgi:mono/diheme cytochrome c family protein
MMAANWSPMLSQAANTQIPDAVQTSGSNDAHAVVVTPDARAQAAEIFTSRCATCHGDQGRGNGPAAANLKPAPMDFHNRNWQRKVTDAQIAQAIVKGGKAVGLSSQMASNPDLESEPAVVAALVERIRKWAK